MEKRNGVTYKVIAIALAALLVSVGGYILNAGANTNDRQDAELREHSGRVTAVEVDVRYIRERVDRIADKLGVE